jgi:hypothetical protein
MAGLQLYNGGVATVANGANILFSSTTLSNDSNVSYNATTGVVTFTNAGSYYVNWSVACSTVSAAAGAVFALVTSSGTYSSGAEIKNGVVTGSAVLNVRAGLTMSVENQSGGVVKLSTAVPTNACLSILNSAPPAATAEGFSAFISNVNVTTGAQLANWSTAAPYFPSPSGSFNATTGSYTAPATGTYLINATINYFTTAVISASLGSGINPAFAVLRTSPTSTALITALMPIFNVNLTLLTLRTILGSGSVNIGGEVQLTAGDVIGLAYQNSGLTINLNLGNSSGIVWSVQRLT